MKPAAIKGTWKVRTLNRCKALFVVMLGLSMTFAAAAARADCDHYNISGTNIEVASTCGVIFNFDWLALACWFDSSDQACEDYQPLYQRFDELAARICELDRPESSEAAGSSRDGLLYVTPRTPEPSDVPRQQVESDFVNAVREAHEAVHDDEDKIVEKRIENSKSFWDDDQSAGVVLKYGIWPGEHDALVHSRLYFGEEGGLSEKFKVAGPEWGEALDFHKAAFSYQKALVTNDVKQRRRLLSKAKMTLGGLKCD